MTKELTPHEQQIADFLAKGGSIQQVAPNVSGRTDGYSAWGAPRKKAGRPAADAPIIELDDEDDL